MQGPAFVIVAACIAGSVTMSVNNFGLIPITLLIVGCGGLTVLIVRNHTKDKIEERARAFDAQFRSAELKDKRRKAAKYVLREEGRQDDVDEVLDFFHDVGKAFEKGEIDLETARHNYSLWLQAYWETWYHYIIEKREKEQVWGYVFPLYDAIRKWAGDKQRKQEELKSFWEGEEAI
jgi:hypothetical protein